MVKAPCINKIKIKGHPRRVCIYAKKSNGSCPKGKQKYTTKNGDWHCINRFRKRRPTFCVKQHVRGRGKICNYPPNENGGCKKNQYSYTRKSGREVCLNKIKNYIKKYDYKCGEKCDPGYTCKTIMYEGNKTKGCWPTKKYVFANMDATKIQTKFRRFLAKKKN